MYISIARQLVVLLPVAYILAKIGGLSMIWWCFPIAEVMSMMISLICLRRTMRTKLAQM
jgi:Na+-driven multidrug efflux pump